MRNLLSVQTMSSISKRTELHGTAEGREWRDAELGDIDGRVCKVTAESADAKPIAPQCRRQ